MKKRRFLFGMLFGVFLGIGLSISVYFLAAKDIDWQKYLEEKLIPALSAGISALVIIWLGVAPTLKKIVSAIALFNKATDNVNDTVQNGKEAKASIEDFKKEVNNEILEQKRMIEQTGKGVSNIEKIVRIGFGNTEELVTKGYASEIAKVGNDNEENEN